MQGMKKGGRRVKAPAQEQDFPNATFDRQPPNSPHPPKQPQRRAKRTERVIRWQGSKGKPRAGGGTP